MLASPGSGSPAAPEAECVAPSKCEYRPPCTLSPRKASGHWDRSGEANFNRAAAVLLTLTQHPDSPRGLLEGGMAQANPGRPQTVALAFFWIRETSSNRAQGPLEGLPGTLLPGDPQSAVCHSAGAFGTLSSGGMAVAWLAGVAVDSGQWVRQPFGIILCRRCLALSAR
ncbi:hypothetical protein CC78DRAFT_573995 [Lojkania enalia]|uniref:Uncharacterized protein n=1 Tax=Lojkania enalia TaxID=147567 RepID=A0A9P4NCV8_9PLEO|nr:hypothetical protein CC78DRAFT_573995 [Didymosphaeria enalia]